MKSKIFLGILIATTTLSLSSCNNGTEDKGSAPIILDAFFAVTNKEIKTFSATKQTAVSDLSYNKSYDLNFLIEDPDRDFKEIRLYYAEDFYDDNNTHYNLITFSDTDTTPFWGSSTFNFPVDYNTDDAKNFFKFVSENGYNAIAIDKNGNKSEPFKINFIIK